MVEPFRSTVEKSSEKPANNRTSDSFSPQISQGASEADREAAEVVNFSPDRISSPRSP
jgi:hypothetical protein